MEIKEFTPHLFQNIPLLGEIDRVAAAHAVWYLETYTIPFSQWVEDISWNDGVIYMDQRDKLCKFVNFYGLSGV